MFFVNSFLLISFNNNIQINTFFFLKWHTNFADACEEYYIKYIYKPFFFKFYSAFFLDMEFVLFSFLFSLLLALIILMLTQILSKISLEAKVLKLEIYKVRAYECGFDAFQLPRLSFIIHFFLIAIFFLIFDLEIVILFPLVFCSGMLNFYNFLLILIYIYIIFLSFFYEMQLNTLTWKFLKDEEFFNIDEFSIFL
jgi:NADH:ubiquinone oxidoreductase subunit 3 (subunit A)